MVPCVLEPHESEAKHPTRIWRDFNWYLSEIGLLFATLAPIITIYYYNYGKAQDWVGVLSYCTTGIIGYQDVAQESWEKIIYPKTIPYSNSAQHRNAQVTKKNSNWPFELKTLHTIKLFSTEHHGINSVGKLLATLI